jgi:hypothetical protein
VALEGRLLEQQDGLINGEQYIDLIEEGPASNSVSDGEQAQSSCSKPYSDGGLPSPRLFTDMMSSKLPGTSRGTFIPELMRADLYVSDAVMIS